MNTTSDTMAGGKGVVDPPSTARIRRRGLALLLGGPFVSGLGLLGTLTMAWLELESIPRALAGAFGIAMAGGIVMVFSGAWYWVTGRDQKHMSQAEKSIFFLAFVTFVALAVVAFVSLDTPSPSRPQGVRGVHPDVVTAGESH